MGCEYKTVKTENGETGICVMPSGEEHDAWAFYRGECGTEFSYCAQMGWPVVEEEGNDSFATKCTTCVLPVADVPHKTVSELLNLGEGSTVEVSRVNYTSFDEGRIKEIKASLPDHFDWRDKDGENWMTPVKNQGGCGSCWAFSTVGIVEPQYNIIYGDPDLDLDLSEQYMVSDCCISCGSCGGGWHATALRFTRDYGITVEACFPYTASNCPCSNRCSDWTDRLKTIDETERVSSDIETIKQYLIEKGPLSVAMGIGISYGGHFDNGIYRCTNDSGINHAVVIVGYDEAENYWIVSNSWGSTWNGDGYFKVGCGECAIESYVYYANLAAAPNEPPLADAGGPYTGTEEVAILFDGSSSSDPDSDPLTYTWDFGDGTAEVTVDIPTVEHIYTTGQAGVDMVYTVTLTVNNGTVNSDAATTTATVAGVNDPPIADADGPYYGFLGQHITFDGSTCSDEEGAIAYYTWNFGDGTLPVTLTVPTAEHTYIELGTYPVTITVEDEDGATDTDNTTVEVTDEPIEVFSDSFDGGSLANWVQDAQNDWLCSIQRAVEGSHSAEVDGWAGDATLTMKDAIDLSGTSQATLTFSWLIESGVDTGEYLALDLWNGTTWDEAARLKGNVDTENVWHNEAIDLSDYLIGDFKLRFRGKMSLSSEDANVDVVRIMLPSTP